MIKYELTLMEICNYAKGNCEECILGLYNKCYKNKYNDLLMNGIRIPIKEIIDFVTLDLENKN